MLSSYVLEMWDLALEGNLQGLFFFISIYLLIVCGYSAIYEERVRRWPSVEGCLLELGIKNFGIDSPSEQKRRIHVTYKYEVNGKAFTGNRLSTWGMTTSGLLNFLLKFQMRGVQRADNGKVNIFYSPSKPEKSFLIKPSMFRVVLITFSSIAPLGVYLAKYHS